MGEWGLRGMVGQDAYCSFVRTGHLCSCSRPQSRGACGVAGLSLTRGCHNQPLTDEIYGNRAALVVTETTNAVRYSPHHDFYSPVQCDSYFQTIVDTIMQTLQR